MRYNGIKTRRLFTFGQMQDMLEKWQREYPDRVSLKSLAKCSGYEIWCAEITDKGVGDDNKQHAVITAMHSGVEYSGANTVLALGCWLLSDDPKADKILKNQKVVLIPCPNPYSYEKGGLENQHRTEFSTDPYGTVWTFEGVRDKKLNKEAAAVQSAIDSYMPELLIDCHGVFYEDQIMVDSTGLSVNGLGRAHSRRFIDMMTEEAENAGFAMDYEDYREKIIPVSENIKEYGYHFQTCSQKINPAVYAYNKYHTLSFTMEISYEESGLIRLKKALELGNVRWPLEFYNGYPVNRIQGEGLISLNPYGRNAYDLRKSRLELWNGFNRYTNIGVFPIMPGKMFRIFVFSQEIKSMLNKTKTSMIYYSIEDLYRINQINQEMLKSCVGEDGDKYYYSADISAEKESSFPESGLAVRFYIPFKDAEVKQVILNGAKISASEYNGYCILKEKNYTVVQICIPPGKKYEVLTVSVDYDFTNTKKDFFHFCGHN